MFYRVFYFQSGGASCTRKFIPWLGIQNVGLRLGKSRASVSLNDDMFQDDITVLLLLEYCDWPKNWKCRFQRERADKDGNARLCGYFSI